MGQATAQLWGVVASEPRTNTVGGSVVMRLSVATDEGWGERKVTTWWSVELWIKSDQEKRLNYLSHALGKSAKVFATGYPCLRSYTDANGHERQSLELKRADVQVIVPAPKEQEVTQPRRSEPELYDESLPF